MVYSVEPEKPAINDKGGKHVNREVAESTKTKFSGAVRPAFIGRSDWGAV